MEATTPHPSLPEITTVDAERANRERLQRVAGYFKGEEGFEVVDSLNAQHHDRFEQEYARRYDALASDTDNPIKSGFLANASNRKLTGSALIRARRAAADRAARHKANRYIGALCDEEVSKLGIEDPDQYDRAYEALYDLATIDEDIWHPAASEDGTPERGMRDDFYECAMRMERTTSEGAAETDDTSEAEVTPEARLAELRGAFIEAAAARMRAPVYYKRKQREQLDEVAKAAQQAYLDQVYAMENSSFEAMISAENPDGTRQYSDEQLKAAFLRQINDRARRDEADIRQAMVEQGSGLRRKLAGALETYANASTKKKILISVGLGTLAAATGFGVGFVAGAAGAAVAAGGAGLMAAGRFGRAYGVRLSRLYKKEEIPTFSADEITTPDYILRSAQAWRQNRLNDTIESADKTKRSAIKWAIGTVAVGGAAGAAMHLVDADVPTAAIGKFRDIMGWHPASPDIDQVPEVPDTDAGTTPDVVDTPKSTIPKDIDVAEAPTAEVYSDDAQSIRAGEGWYQTFKELGVPREDWTQLLEQAGPRLQEMGVAYRAPELGGYGMNMTADAKMPQEALDYLSSLAREHGYLSQPEAPQVDVAQPVEQSWQEAAPETVEPPVAEVDAATAAQDEINGFNRDAVSPENRDVMSQIGLNTAALEINSEIQPMKAVQNLVSSEVVAHAMTNTESAQLARTLGIGRADLQAIINEVGRTMSRLHYEDTNHSPVFYLSAGNWKLNTMSGNKLPESVMMMLRERAATTQGS